MKSKISSEFNSVIETLNEKDMNKDKEFTKSLIENIRKNKDETAMILGLSSYLESCINAVIEARAINLDSKALLTWSKNLYVPINQKIKFLRFMNLISEIGYEDLTNLFKVRNIIAHRNQASKHKEDLFQSIDISKLAKNTKYKGTEEANRVKMMLFVILVGRYSFNFEFMSEVLSKSPPNAETSVLAQFREVGGRS